MATTKWVLDPTHSEVEFKIRHMMISTVSGKFTQFAAEVQTEAEDFMTARVSFTVDVKSITTGNEQRDGHLQAPDFFDAARFPEIKFTTTKYENVDNDGSYEVYGNLTIRDVTKQVKLDAEFGGVARVASRLAGPVLWWTTRREEGRLAAGWTYEPPTIIERTNWGTV